MFLTAIGKIYGDLGNFNRAKEHLLKSLDLLKKKNNTSFSILRV